MDQLISRDSGLGLDRPWHARKGPRIGLVAALVVLALGWWALAGGHRGAGAAADSAPAKDAKDAK